MSKNDSDDAAGRRQRLQALREQIGQDPGAAKTGEARPKRKFQGRKNAGGESGDDRKRQFVKNLIKKKMQQGSGESGGGEQQNGNKRELLGEAIKQRKGKAATSDAKLDKFPRLKAIIEQRRAQDAQSASVPVEQLEHRVSKLEDEVRKTKESLAGKKTPDPAGSAGKDEGKK